MQRMSTFSKHQTIQATAVRASHIAYHSEEQREISFHERKIERGYRSKAIEESNAKLKNLDREDVLEKIVRDERQSLSLSLTKDFPTS